MEWQIGKPISTRSITIIIVVLFLGVLCSAIPSYPNFSSFPKPTSAYNSIPVITPDTNYGWPLWNQTYGYTNGDAAASVIECSNGGFALVGWTYSGNPTWDDVLLVRTDENGNHLWNFTYAGGNTDWGSSVIECSVGGFAIVGLTDSYGAGYDDFWLIRTDENGNHLWNHTYGGSSTELNAEQIIECSDGGFALVGSSRSYGPGDLDILLVRTDMNGNELWSRNYNGLNPYEPDDWGFSVVECTAGGFAITGATTHSVVDYEDVWLIRTNSTGHHLWNQTFGDQWNHESGRFLVECHDGGFAIASTNYTESTELDYCLIRTDLNGNFLWSRSYHNGDNDEVEELVECNSGGFALVGTIDASNNNFWVVRTDSNGNILWSRTYGGNYREVGLSITEVTGGGFAIAGTTRSYGVGSADMWLVRLHEPPIFWLEDPSSQLCEFGTSFWYDLDVLAYGGISHWWLNDSDPFVIDSEGTITNSSDLFIGEYDVEVWVNNTLGNTLNASFSVYYQDTTPPDWNPTPVDQVVELGDAFSYDLDVSDLSPIDSWWLNDTMHFAITMTGLITNVTSLSVGFYGIEVGVNDSFNNIQTYSFRIRVQDTTIPSWLTTPTDQIIEYDEAFSYQLFATDLSGISIWTINDTAHFHITGLGLIINSTTLDPGRYGLLVTVYDPYHNPASETLTVTVNEPGTTPTTPTEPTTPSFPPIPGFLLPAIIIGTVGIIGVFILLRYRKRI